MYFAVLKSIQKMMQKKMFSKNITVHFFTLAIIACFINILVKIFVFLPVEHRSYNGGP